MAVEIAEDLMAFLDEESSRARMEALQLRAETALKSYNGDYYGDEVDGNSKVVSRDVAETINYMTVAVLRTFVSGDRVAEFEPDNHEAEQFADDATEVITRQFAYKGYQILHDWLKEGNISALGIVKTTAERKRERVEFVTHDPEGDGAIEANHIGTHPESGIDLFHAVKLQDGKVEFRDYLVPLEEFRISPEARDPDDAVYIAHACPVTISDLVQLGFDPEDLENIQGDDDSQFSPLSFARDEGLNTFAYNDRIGPNRRVILMEEYVRFDADRDGIAERLCVWRVGTTILKIEPIDYQPFVIYCPFPMPARIVGDSLADQVTDIQRIRTATMRLMLDGSYRNLAPRIYVPEECVTASTYDDLLTVIPGGIVRFKGANRPEPEAKNDVSGVALQIMEFLSGEIESRTGITRMNQGLDADALNKMLCVETPVPMASGDYKRLADIEDGDWIVGSDGFSVRVSKAHKIHDPERAYRLSFSSGEKIDAGGEHLWTVRTDNDKRYNKSQTVDTDRLFEMVQGKSLVYIPRVQRPETGHERELPLDPYMLGTWLGDGSLHAPRITTMELETVGYAEGWAAERGGLTVDKHQNSGAAKSYYVKGLYPVLRGMKMLKRGDAAKDADIIGKHIPEEYFRASYRQRLELLRGLMDTDGCHHSNALCVFVQNGGRLLDDTVRLIESLGGWPSVRNASVEGAYQVTFSLADCPFKLTRKAKDWTAPKANAATQVIKSVEPIAIKPMRCLTVDADDGLFCVGKRFTVTHNTATGTALMQASGRQMEEYLARNFAEAVSKLMRLKYKLIKRFGGIMKLRVDGQYRDIDPSQWPDDMDVVIRVGLGTGHKDQRVQNRMQFLQVMREVMLGGVPIVQPEQLYKMMAGLAKDMGLGSPNDYVIDPSTLPAPQPGQQPPDPEQQKVQGMLQLNAQKLQMQGQKEQATLQLKQQEMAAKLGTQQQVESGKLQLQQENNLMQAHIAHQGQVMDQNLQMRKMDLAAHVAAQDHERKTLESEAKVKQMRQGGALDK